MSQSSDFRGNSQQSLPVLSERVAGTAAVSCGLWGLEGDGIFLPSLPSSREARRGLLALLEMLCPILLITQMKYMEINENMGTCLNRLCIAVVECVRLGTFIKKRRLFQPRDSKGRRVERRALWWEDLSHFSSWWKEKGLGSRPTP